MTDETPAPPNPAQLPDITKDRILVALGATGLVVDQPVALAGGCRTAVAFAPVGPSAEGEPPAQVRPAEVRLEAVCGTVDQIVAHFRAGLERAFYAMANRRDDGTYHVNPTLGTVGVSNQDALAAAYPPTPDGKACVRPAQAPADYGTAAYAEDMKLVTGLLAQARDYLDARPHRGDLVDGNAAAWLLRRLGDHYQAYGRATAAPYPPPKPPKV